MYNLKEKISMKYHRQKKEIFFKINEKILDIKRNDIINKLIAKLKKKNNQILSKIRFDEIIHDFNPTLLVNFVQDKFEKTLSSDINKIVLKQSKFWIRAITWVLMGGTTFGIVWISVAKTDEVVIAFGKLEPQGGSVEVQMPLEGIAREILIQEGDRVKKNQVLIRLDTELTEAKINNLKNKLISNKKLLERLRNLVKEGAVSELQYIQQEILVEDLKSEMKSNEVKLKYQEIIAPISGTVFELKPKTPGFVARTSEPVLQIVPTENLVAKIEIDSRTIGFVKPGKNTQISIDSFPSTDFGVIEGVVTSIGSDALPPEPSQGKGYRFPAEVKLNTQFLELKSGKKLTLQAGMSLSANIKLRKVTYIQLLLNTFSDKAASLKSI